MTTPVTTVVSPLPVAWQGLVWLWLRQYPARNFDDGAPTTFEGFLVHLAALEDAGVRSWGVNADGVPVGAVWYHPMTARVGRLPFCFSDRVWGTGVARAAVSEITAALFATHVIDKIVFAPFADNTRCIAFLTRIGAVHEGLLRAQDVRQGEPIDIELMAMFRPGV
jgi:RimJ/RimL family protein N-acetyltransferase